MWPHLPSSLETELAAETSQQVRRIDAELAELAGMLLVAHVVGQLLCGVLRGVVIAAVAQLLKNQVSGNLHHGLRRVQPLQGG